MSYRCDAYDFNSKKFNKARGKLVSVPLEGDSVFVIRSSENIPAGYYFAEVGGYRYFKKRETAILYLESYCFFEPAMARNLCERMERQALKTVAEINVNKTARAVLQN